MKHLCWFSYGVVGISYYVNALYCEQTYFSSSTKPLIHAYSSPL